MQVMLINVTTVVILGMHWAFPEKNISELKRRKLPVKLGNRNGEKVIMGLTQRNMAVVDWTNI